MQGIPQFTFKNNDKNSLDFLKTDEDVTDIFWGNSIYDLFVSAFDGSIRCVSVVSGGFVESSCRYLNRCCDKPSFVSRVIGFDEKNSDFLWEEKFSNSMKYGFGSCDFRKKTIDNLCLLDEKSFEF